MKKLRNMQAMANENFLISYDTSTALKIGRWSIIRDYPTNTSKKHLRAWLDDYYGLESVKGSMFECYKNYRNSAECAIFTARRLHHEYIILHCTEDGWWTYATYSTRKEMENDVFYHLLLQDITPTI